MESPWDKRISFFFKDLDEPAARTTVTMATAKMAPEVFHDPKRVLPELIHLLKIYSLSLHHGKFFL